MQAAPLTAHRRQVHALTGIRFFAATYVILFHAKLGSMFVRSGYHFAANFFQNGFLAVPLFFILSGFIVAYTYAGQIETASQIRRFFEARFSRIWPLYALSLVLISIPPVHLPSPGVMVATIAMLQAWNPFDIAMAGAWNAVCWTISCEFFFYLCFPAAQRFCERKDKRMLALSLAAVLAVCVGMNTAGRPLWYSAEGAFRYVPLPIIHLPEFLVGVVLGNLFLRRSFSPSARSGLPGKGLVSYAAGLVVIALLCRPASAWTSLIIPAYALLLYALAAERTWLSLLLSSRWLVLGGGMSYAMYLIQVAAKNWMTIAMAHLPGQSQIFRLFATMFALLLASYALFRGFENPVRKLLRNFFAEREVALASVLDEVHDPAARHH